MNFTFKAPPNCPYDEIRGFGVVRNGVNPLAGWQHRRARGDCSVLKKDDTIVVMVWLGASVWTTTYWHVSAEDAARILAVCKGEADFSEIFSKRSAEMTWSGGPEELGVPAAYSYLAMGARSRGSDWETPC